MTEDGTWQKRYGHNSKLGATFVISADTEEVLDYEIKSTVCKGCEYHEGDSTESDTFKKWKRNHKCGKNHQGSAV